VSRKSLKVTSSFLFFLSLNETSLPFYISYNSVSVFRQVLVNNLLVVTLMNVMLAKINTAGREVK